MADIDRILGELNRAYQYNQSGGEIPLHLRARILCSYAKEYASAAAVLESSGPQHILARTQLTGHALELAMKACVAAAGKEPPRGQEGHDLVHGE